MRWKWQILVSGLLLGSLSMSALAVGFGGALWGTTVRMDEVNAIVREYNHTAQASVPELSFGIGGVLQAIVPLSLADVYVAMQGVVSQAGSARQTVTTALVGPCLGVTLAMGPVVVSSDVGIYRSTLSFPAARYQSLSGWAGGWVGRVAYELRITDALRASLGVSAAWLPVLSLKDAEGSLYQSREGPFLDFSGIGISIGFRWKT